MSEKEFKTLSEALYSRVMDAFETIDPDAAEAYFHLDNVAITFGNGTRFVVNRQNPVKQIWLATKKKGLHFTYDEKGKRWLCDKTGAEFFDVLSASCGEELGFPVTV